MNKKDFGEPLSRNSQIKKEQMDLFRDLVRSSNYVSIFDESDLRELINNRPKIDPEISKLIEREPPIIGPLKIKGKNIPISPAQNRINRINNLKNLTLLFKYDERVVYPKHYAAIDNIRIKVIGIEKLNENDVEVTFTAPYDEIEVFIYDEYNGKPKIYAVKFS